MNHLYVPTSDEQIISMLCYAAEVKRTHGNTPDGLGRQLALMVATHGDRLADALTLASKEWGELA